MPHTLTIYTAVPGTPLVENNALTGSSAAGHMWYAIDDGITQNSYGFQPALHGAASGPGKVVISDTTAYQNPYYSRTLEITEDQYKKLKEYGDDGLSSKWNHFKGDYQGLTNSCVDFTWGGLKHAGLQMNTLRTAPSEFDTTAPTKTPGEIPRHFEGVAKPGDNKPYIESLVPPFPDSPLNTSHENPIPTNRTLLQRLLSENDATPEQQQQASQFRDQLGERLKQAGMSDQQVDTLAAASVNHLAHHTGKGSPENFYLSKDGSTIAIKHEWHQLSEFKVDAALGQSEQAHWQNAIQTQQRSSEQQAITTQQEYASPSHELHAPALARA